ncbi:uncharacterized protein N7459_008552 [Penicillium hispanicum]|uniref:uncharacterized protein n=1 Tax=Penicillium hispanicum TaxID=1080232 RepID=UPI00253FDB15|nr:uncharacterized protein N7459_008552 [Penicillium hispanicum]KAJ5574125.1 hypothetical protein N7459_008552 [Penicillium hispanicum]
MPAFPKKRRNTKKPLWVWHSTQAEGRLQDILARLKCTFDNTLTDKRLKALGIELHDLDFQSGVACCSTRSYFMPRRDGVYKIGNEEIPQSKLRSYGWNSWVGPGTGPGYDLGEQDDIVIAFEEYAYRLEKEGAQKSWKAVPHTSSSCGDTVVKQGQHRSTVFRGASALGLHQCHRQVWVTSNKDGVRDETRLSVSELIVLVSWMLGGVRRQMKVISKWAQAKYIPPHHVVPTMVISFHPQERARVMCGYFDGTLKVQFTKFQEFDGFDVVDMRSYLLQWAWPVTCDRTTRFIASLPPIPENAEDGIIDEKAGITDQKEAEPVAPKKWRFRQKLLSFAVGRAYFQGKSVVKEKAAIRHRCIFNSY